MAKGMSASAGKYAPARVKAEIMPFPSWSDWLKFKKWQFHCGVTLLYVSHKRAEDGRVWVRFEVC